MNYENNEMLTSPNLSYTSRDYNSIYNELINSIPLLTTEWDPKDENDPGIVLIKLLSMLGDMLSYNQDKAALEAFPRTVLQKINAQQIFRLVGYKMHWYRSASVEATFTNNNMFSIHVGRYNVFTTRTSGITYTNLKEFTIPGGTYNYNSYKTTLLQGRPITPVMKSSIKSTDYNASWHEIYDYNLSSDDVVNDKIYLKYNNIEETSIILVDNDEKPFAINEWTLVNNINLTESQDKVFEFCVDDDGALYLQLPSYWKEKYVITKFKLFFVLSDGKNGEIEENSIIRISDKKCYTDVEGINISSALSQLVYYNTPSTYGYNPETCSEARINAEKYQNTIDTLVILRDFEKAVMRIDSVANVVATDVQNDPHPSELGDNQINLYVVRKNDYNNSGSDYIYNVNSEGSDSSGISASDELFKENIIGELKSYKVMPCNINVYLENKIDWIDWTVTGQIFLRKPINLDDNHNLMVKINDNLKNRFNCETLDFNEPINYMDTIECIMKTDKNIWHVDLDSAAIQYSRVKRSNKGNPTGYEIKNKYMIYDSNGNYTGYYATSLGCSDTEMDVLREYDNYIDVYGDLSSEPGFLPGTGSNSSTSTTYAISEKNEKVKVNSAANITPGGNGSGKNSGNRIIREDGRTYSIINNEVREYEIYNRMIYDWTGEKPRFTGYIISMELVDGTNDEYKIQKMGEYGVLEDSGYILKFDSRLYTPDGFDANKYFAIGNPIIIPQLSETVKRDIYNIYDLDSGSITNEIVDKLTGEIFIKRGNVFYSANKTFDEETGQILDTLGPVLYDETFSVIREPACKEDVTGEYFQTYEIGDNQTNFEFYLGQDADGNALTDSIGKNIVAFPIKPYSLVIYIDGDIEVLADNGAGKITGTPGLLNGYGSINYETGYVKFKLNIVPTSMKISYVVNKLSYAHYVDFDINELFVRNEYIRNDTRK